MDMTSSSMSPNDTMSPESSMAGGMASTFSSSTRVTLWFSDWTTTSTTTYVLTIVFLFSLGMFNRFLGAFKSQLERKWSRQHSVVNKESYTKSADSPGLAGHARQWSRALRTPVVRLEEPEDKETNPLSPLPPMEDSTNSLEKTVVSWRGFWMPSVPWSITRDGISAVLEFVRALIGYILMLAVMTYNIGFLFAVTGSVLLGELVFGRYTKGAIGLAEDGCHT